MAVETGERLPAQEKAVSLRVLQFLHLVERGQRMERAVSLVALAVQDSGRTQSQVITRLHGYELDVFYVPLGVRPGGPASGKGAATANSLVGVTLLGIGALAGRGLSIDQQDHGACNKSGGAHG